ncbi:ABC transporter substrate-binding protein [Pseudoroseomonas wenyumeiae]
MLRFVPFVDLSLLDPVATTATPTRNHAFLIFDTLYGLDSNFQPQPQMVEGHVVEDDGRRWLLTLRDGLRFHDGSAVTAKDCVASIKRWASRDSFGQALMVATDELSARDDKTIVFRLNKPFPLLPAALAKASPSMCAIMPERLAVTDAAKQVTEMVGSGPFRFLDKEHMAGARAAYARFEGYVPRQGGAPGGTAGPKVAHFERVEWTVMPDVSAASSALQAGEVDWWKRLPRPGADVEAGPQPARGGEGPPGPDAHPALQLHPAALDNVALRRAVLAAVDQAEFMQAYSSDPETWHVKLGMFCPGTPWPAMLAWTSSLARQISRPRARPWPNPATRARRWPSCCRWTTPSARRSGRWASTSSSASA